MANFSISNIDVLQSKEVRLYRVSKDGTMVPAAGMTELDAGNASAGVRLGRRHINPITNASGVLEINDDKTFESLEVTNLDDVDLTPTNAAGVKSALETIGFEVHDLAVWSPGP